MRSGGRRTPMPAETAPLVLCAGQIVLTDGRGDALPKEPNKRRPTVVVEDDGLFAPSYPNMATPVTLAQVVNA
jgi:mRNA interferase MazF